MHAALEGARQICFTVILISLYLIAAFIPLLFMGGIVRRLFREFSVTLAFAIVTSTIVSLSVTPMVCAHFARNVPEAGRSWLDRVVETMLSRVINLYGASLSVILRYQALTLIVMLAMIWLAVDLYIGTPKGYLPQDDTGLLFGSTQASPDTSYSAMLDLQKRVAEVVRADPAVASVGSSIGGSAFGGALNQGHVFVGLKSIAERDGVMVAQVIDRLRAKLHEVAGIRLILTPAQDLRAGGRQTRSQYQYTLWGL
jgi:multidrug efflux pump subunit AcrB